MTTRDRRPYLTSNVLDQDFLDECQDNLECRLEMVVDIEAPDGSIIRASDRNKYVGGTFYESLLKFPPIRKTIGEWLEPTLEFSTLKLELSNVDGRFNKFLPAGDDYEDWIDNTVTVRYGLRDVDSTYTTIFQGFVTEVAGFGRSQRTISILARDRYDQINRTFPRSVFRNDDFPNIEDANIGVGIPIIYGDWTHNLRNAAMVPVFVVNGADPDVDGTNDPTRNPVQFVVSSGDNQSLDAGWVYFKTGDRFINVPSSEITVGLGNKSFDLIQNGVAWVSDEEGNLTQYTYTSGDSFLVRIIGKDLGAYTENAVEIARDILKDFGNLSSGDFDPNWDTFRDKSSPSESAISTFRARAWVSEPQRALEYSLQILEQIRLEVFVERTTFDLKINSLHFEDWPASPSYRLKDWDLGENTLKISIDDSTTFNRAQADYNFSPDLNQNSFKTSIFRNQASIDATKPVSKLITFPNLTEESVVIDQTREIIKLSSSMFEILELDVTWRSILKDIGDFLVFDVRIGSTVFDNVNCMVRELGYTSQGRVPLKIWSLQMTPYPGYEPNNAGTVGGYNATITEET